MHELKLTAAQCKYLGGLISSSVGPAPWEPKDTVISDWDQEGWIFVENADSVGQEGSGVWVDTQGHEQHGPVAA